MGTAVLSEVNITATHLDKYRRLIDSTQLWHKFIISNTASVDRNILLDSVLQTVFPYDLIPLCFKKVDLDSHFLAKNCKDAIKELYNKGLVIQNPINGEMLNVTIILGFKKLSEWDVKYHKNILRVISKRYSKFDSCLDLSRFHEDPELMEYFPLNQPRILEGVLRLCKGIDIRSLDLSENRISQLKSLTSIWKYSDLKHLDLSRNMINSFEELEILRKFNSLEEINLEGNPFCPQYNGYDYVQSILTLLPNLKKLDFGAIEKKDLLSFKKNYLCCYQSQSFVDQFLDHFFTLYDNERSSLRDMYNLDATLTISCHYNKDRENYAEANLECYTSFARNLKTLSDITSSYDNMFMGCNNIMTILCQLPPTRHDTCSFTVDLVSFSYDFAVVTVTGIFQEVGGQILCFNRTFVLVSADGFQYFIVNDKLHINQATVEQFHNAFEEVSISNVNAVSEITTMNLQWSKKCLKDCDGDLKTALISFCELFQKDEVPKEAFVRSFILIDPINFNFKSGINTFTSDVYTTEETVRSNGQNYWDEEHLNTQNKKLLLEKETSNLKTGNDIFKLARQNLDLKMKQLNDDNKAEDINKENLIQDEVLLQNSTRANSQEWKQYADSLYTKTLFTEFGEHKNFKQNDVILKDSIKRPLLSFQISKRNNEKIPTAHTTLTSTSQINTAISSTSQINTAMLQNINNVPSCTPFANFDGTVYSSWTPNSLPNLPLNSDTDKSTKSNKAFISQPSFFNSQSISPHYTARKNAKKNKFLKINVKSNKNTRKKQKKQRTRRKAVNNAPKKFKKKMRLLSTLAKQKYRKTQDILIGMELTNINSYPFRVVFRLGYLAFIAYMDLVNKTKYKMRKTWDFNYRLINFKHFIRPLYGDNGINYNSGRIKELDGASDNLKLEDVKREQPQHFFQNNSTLARFNNYDKNKIMSLQPNSVRPLVTNRTYNNLIETQSNFNLDIKVVRTLPSFTTIGNINKKSRNVSNRNRELIRENNEQRRFLKRQANKLTELNERLRSTDNKITTNSYNVSAHVPLPCSSQVLNKEPVKNEVKTINDFKPEVQGKKNHRQIRRRERRRAARSRARQIFRELARQGQN